VRDRGRPRARAPVQRLWPPTRYDNLLSLSAGDRTSAESGSGVSWVV